MKWLSRASKDGFTKVHENISRADLTDELDDRGIKWKVSDSTAVLKDRLATNMEGMRIKRIKFDQLKVVRNISY